MRFLAFVVARNEENKFLNSWIEHYKGMFDGRHVYDDRSTDRTRDLLVDAGWKVTERPVDAPSFLDHEGEFRQDGWDAAARALEAEPGDLIAVPDCDEFLMGEIPATPGVYDLPIDEIWRLDPPMVRTDGGWRNHGPRITVYEPGAKFRDIRCGPGSIPLTDLPLVQSDLRMLHYGYCVPGAPQVKYARYSNPESNRHSPGHIESILRRPKLEPYSRPVPDVYLGSCNHHPP